VTTAAGPCARPADPCDAARARRPPPAAAPLPPAFALLLLALGLRGAAAEAPRAAPPPPWLTELRVVGPDGDLGGLLPVHPDLPGRFGGASEREARDTSFSARSAISHPAPAWWQLLPVARRLFPPPALDRAALEQDVGRVEAWFRDQGYLEVDVRLHLEPDPTPWGRAPGRWSPDGAWRAAFVVEPGPRWSVARVELQVEPGTPRGLRRALEAALPVDAGVYSGEARMAAEAALRRTAAAAGHPLPYVVSVLVPDPGPLRGATLLLYVDAGEPATFGPVELRGLRALDRAGVRRRLARGLPEGEPWDGDRVDALEEGLRRLPAFAGVRVVPGEPGVDGAVPVVAELEEAPAAGLKPLVSVSSEPSLFSAALGVGWSHPRVGRGLARAQARASLGYRAMPVIFGPSTFYGNHGPIGGAALGVERFGPPLSGTSAFIELEGMLDAQRAINEAGARGRVGLRWRPGPRLSLSVSPELGAFQSFAWQGQEVYADPWFAAGAEPMGGGPRPRFRRGGFERAARVDLRWVAVDDRDDPREGAVLEARTHPFGWIGADPFSRLRLDARGFVPLAQGRLVLSPRAAAGWMAWHRAGALEALPARFYLGGAADLRGWGARMVNPPGWDGDINDLRIGGNTMLLGSLEGALHLWPQLAAVAFVDSGRVWERLLDDPATGARGVDLRELQTSAGLGLRLPTPLGRVETSAAVRLSPETHQVERVAPLNVHLTIEQPF